MCLVEALPMIECCIYILDISTNICLSTLLCIIGSEQSSQNRNVCRLPTICFSAQTVGCRWSLYRWKNGHVIGLLNQHVTYSSLHSQSFWLVRNEVIGVFTNCYVQSLISDKHIQLQSILINMRSGCLFVLKYVEPVWKTYTAHISK